VRGAARRQGILVRAGLFGVTVVVAMTVVTPTAGADPLPPPNPSDAQIQQSQGRAHTASAEVGRLSAVVTATQATIQQLQDATELKAELAMKAQVDLQMAHMAADDAKAAADDAKKTAAASAEEITDAEQHAADFAAASFRQGTVMGSMAALLDSDSMGDLLARQQMIEQVSANQAGVLAQLNEARTAKANLDSAAKAAAIKADQAAADAVAAKAEADKAWQAAADAFDNGQQQLAALQTQLDQQQAQYQAALNNVALLQSQKLQYQAWLTAKQEAEQRLAAQAAVQQDEADNLRRERQAAAQLANEEASNRAIAIKNEKARQAKLRKEREEAERLRKQAEARGLDPNTVTIPSDGTRGQLVVNAALKYLGTTYAWGGGNANGPTRGIRDYGVADRYGDYKKVGFDCSGLALYAWAQQGVYLPHYSGYQYNYGTKVSKSNLQPGDLVFYAYNTSNPATIHHVAIYMGGGKMVEAPQSGSVVKISPMRWSGYIGATRPGV
jgi:cell wall-associated NlpC family hydrolase